MAMFYNFGDFDAQGNERPCTGCGECRPALTRHRARAAVRTARERINAARVSSGHAAIALDDDVAWGNLSKL